MAHIALSVKDVSRDNEENLFLKLFPEGKGFDIFFFPSETAKKQNFEYSFDRRVPKKVISYYNQLQNYANFSFIYCLFKLHLG